MPGISQRSVPSAAFTALGIPSVVSWSVKAMAARFHEYASISVVFSFYSIFMVKESQIKVKQLYFLLVKVKIYLDLLL